MFEFLIVLLLVLINGILAGAEMAVVTANKGRLDALAAAGDRRARNVLRLRETPESFLATIQVGITLVAALAGAFGGSAFAGRLAPLLADAGLGDAAPEVAFVLVVALITYLSVVFGELVPKSLALRVAERYARWVAGPLLVTARIARPVVWLLTASSNLVLRAFGDHTDFMESRLTREDLEHMVGAAQTEGALDVPTGRLVRRALEFTRLRVGDVMVHRRDVVDVQRAATPEQLREKLLASGHRRLPVVDGTLDHVVGYVLRDDVFAALLRGEEPDLGALLRPPFFVAEPTTAERALRELQKHSRHMAVVVEETGGVAGIVTLEDLVEELVGEIFDELDHPEPRAIHRESTTTWLVQGSAELREVTRELGFALPAPPGVRTVGGLCIALAGDRIPTAGAVFEVGEGLALEVVDASARRVRHARLRVPPHTARGT